MKYFVSIGDDHYHLWQVQILINSFIKANLQDKLFVSISTNNYKSKINLNFNNVYFFYNEGKIKDYLKYNKWYCLYQLLQNKVISSPVTVLEPHTAIIKDTSDIKGDIIYNINDDFVFKEEYLVNDIDRESVEINWLRLGDNIVFSNKIETSFFLNILQNMEFYSMFLDDYKNLDKFCLMNAIWKNEIKSVVGLNNLESYLPQNQLNYILDYKHGFKNKFNKIYFKNNINFSGDSLKDTVSKNRYSECLNFFYNLI